MLKYC